MGNEDFIFVIYMYHSAKSGIALIEDKISGLLFVLGFAKVCQVPWISLVWIF